MCVVGVWARGKMVKVAGRTLLAESRLRQATRRCGPRWWPNSQPNITSPSPRPRWLQRRRVLPKWSKEMLPP